MKTAIVHVETFDDVTSISDKILWCRSNRILLVLPRQKRPFPGRVDLNLITRCAKENGAMLAVVSRSDITREYAQSLGIPVFRSIPEADRGDWSETVTGHQHAESLRGKEAILAMRETLPASGGKKPLDHRIRLVLFSLSILALFALAIYVIPSARVIIYSKPELQELTLEVRATTDVTQINITGLIPAYEGAVTVSGQKTAMSSGSVAVGLEKATGEVLFKNLTTSDLVLPAGTIVSTGGEAVTRFETVNKVTLSPGSEEVVVRVEAVLPGTEGNIQPGQIMIVEGTLGAKTEASNSEAFSGGSSQNIAAPTALDFTLLRYQLLDELEKQAEAAAEFNNGDGKEAINGSLVLSEVVTEEQLNSIENPSDTLTLDMTVKYSFLYYDPAQVEDLVNQVMNLSIPEGFHKADRKIAIANQGGVRMEESGGATWTVITSRGITKQLEVESLLSRIRGKTKAEAVAILNDEILHARSAEIITFVKWWPWLPFLSSRINMEEGLADGG